MALPYKLLKSVTIDGETMGLDPDLGKDWNNLVTGLSSPGSLNLIEGAKLTLSEAGLYLLHHSTIYDGNGASNQTEPYVAQYEFKLNGSSTWNYLDYDSVWGNGWSRIHFSGNRVFFLEENEAPAQVRIAIGSWVARSDCESILSATKLITMQ